MSADESTVAAASPLSGKLDRSEKILRAKELYSHGSRNFLVKSYAEAADELSEVCALYEELYGELSDELGMPYLLYAKSLIALAMDENKVIDVPDEEEEDADDDDDEDEEAADPEAMETDAAAPAQSKNGVKLEAIKEQNAAANADKKTDEAVSSTAAEGNGAASKTADIEMEVDKAAVAEVSSSADDDAAAAGATKPKPTSEADDERPSTSNGDAENSDQAAVEEGEEEDENASSLQLAWEILELAAKIFSRQGMGGLPNLAEVQTELANIEFENNIVDAAREDYEKALKIYNELPTNYRRAMAEIHYKIGLTYLMQNQMKEGAASLKEACHLIEGEIEEIKAKPEPTEKDKNNIQDMEETKQEIWAKIAEIEDAQAQNVAEVRAALDSYIKPIATDAADGAGPSSSAAASTSASSSVAAAAATSSSTAAASSSSASSNAAITSSNTSAKPTDITHLIKRKKPEESSSEAEAASAPKRSAV